MIKLSKSTTINMPKSMMWITSADNVDKSLMIIRLNFAINVAQREPCKQHKNQINKQSPTNLIRTLPWMVIHNWLLLTANKSSQTIKHSKPMNQPRCRLIQVLYRQMLMMHSRRMRIQCLKMQWVIKTRVALYNELLY